jgi:hypothetical protein
VSTVTENDVEAEILRFLVRHGWIVRRQHSGVFRTNAGHSVRIGEKGMADWSAMKPTGRGTVRYLEVEVKAPGKAARPEQREYIAKRKHQGISCCVADSGLAFEEWYFAEGFE